MFAVAGLPAIPGNMTNGVGAAGPNQVLAGEMGIIVSPGRCVFFGFSVVWEVALGVRLCSGVLLPLVRLYRCKMDRRIAVHCNRRV
jgi:hypothetical protein